MAALPPLPLLLPESVPEPWPVLPDLPAVWAPPMPGRCGESTMLARRPYPGQSQLDADDPYLLPWALPHTDNLGIQSCTLSAITPPSGVPSRATCVCMPVSSHTTKLTSPCITTERLMPLGNDPLSTSSPLTYTPLTLPSAAPEKEGCRIGTANCPFSSPIPAWNDHLI